MLAACGRTPTGPAYAQQALPEPEAPDVASLDADQPTGTAQGAISADTTTTRNAAEDLSRREAELAAREQELRAAAGGIAPGARTARGRIARALLGGHWHGSFATTRTKRRCRPPLRHEQHPEGAVAADRGAAGHAARDRTDREREHQDRARGRSRRRAPGDRSRGGRATRGRRRRHGHGQRDRTGLRAATRWTVRRCSA